jgi:hypothetical protein
MAKKKKQYGDQPLPEELLDRGIAILEGPLNRVMERVLKSRLVLWPVGLSFKVTTRLLGVVVGARHDRRS